MLVALSNAKCFRCILMKGGVTLVVTVHLQKYVRQVTGIVAVEA